MVEEKQTINHEEHVIVSPRDLQFPHHIIEGGDYEHGFFCPKCDSSLIYMPEEYAKNNLMNSIKPESDSSTMPGHQVNDGWDKIVLKCDNCKCTDLVMKFMKERERINYGDLIKPAVSYPRRYYSPLSTTSSGRLYRAKSRKPYTRKLWQNTI
jgi:hypothetical protein